MSVWQYQATGDETEIFDAADDEATPIVLVPFLDTETPEGHQARVRMVVAAPQGNALLRDALHALNLFPNRRFSDAHTDTYALASAIDRHLKEISDG